MTRPPNREPITKIASRLQPDPRSREARFHSPRRGGLKKRFEDYCSEISKWYGTINVSKFLANFIEKNPIYKVAKEAIKEIGRDALKESKWLVPVLFEVSERAVLRLSKYVPDVHLNLNQRIIKPELTTKNDLTRYL
ncbi:MAG: hypothetical protein GC191_14630 [Azospirillum sp.]|nr:hypothetical protein [Azospirillum sp.]